MAKKKAAKKAVKTTPKKKTAKKAAARPIKKKVVKKVVSKKPVSKKSLKKASKKTVKQVKKAPVQTVYKKILSNIWKHVQKNGLNFSYADVRTASSAIYHDLYEGLNPNKVKVADIISEFTRRTSKKKGRADGRLLYAKIIKTVNAEIKRREMDMPYAQIRQLVIEKIYPHFKGRSASRVSKREIIAYLDQVFDSGFNIFHVKLEDFEGEWFTINDILYKGHELYAGIFVRVNGGDKHGKTIIFDLEDYKDNAYYDLGVKDICDSITNDFGGTALYPFWQGKIKLKPDHTDNGISNNYFVDIILMVKEDMPIEGADLPEEEILPDHLTRKQAKDRDQRLKNAERKKRQSKKKKKDELIRKSVRTRIRPKTDEKKLLDSPAIKKAKEKIAKKKTQRPKSEKWSKAKFEKERQKVVARNKPVNDAVKKFGQYRKTRAWQAKFPIFIDIIKSYDKQLQKKKISIKDFNKLVDQTIQILSKTRVK